MNKLRFFLQIRLNPTPNAKEHLHDAERFSYRSTERLPRCRDPLHPIPAGHHFRHRFPVVGSCPHAPAAGCSDRAGARADASNPAGSQAAQMGRNSVMCTGRITILKELSPTLSFCRILSGLTECDRTKV